MEQVNKYNEIPEDVKEYYEKKLQETGIRMVPGHYPVLETKNEVDMYFSMCEQIVSAGKKARK